MRKIIFIAAVCVFTALFFVVESRPLFPRPGDLRRVEIVPGQGLRSIATQLYDKEVIRSPFVFALRALLSEEAKALKPGVYFFPNPTTISDILGKLAIGREEISVTVLEGNSVYEIDDLLSQNEIINRGELVSYVKNHELEGKLFPDTYRFFENSGGEDSAKKMSSNFAEKFKSLLGKDEKISEDNLNLASIIQNEVPDYQEQRVVAGILKKRTEAGMPLQVDASICYYKEKTNWEDGKKPKCDLNKFDFQSDSPYNTYRNSGLPPTPIGNPGIQAIKAVLEAKSSAYWYYVSDPKTKRTIFAATIEEHNRNVARYLAE